MFESRISSFFRYPSFVLRPFFLLLLFFATASFAQRPPERPLPLDPIQAERNARDLIADMLAQKSEGNSSKTGTLKIRDSKGVEKEVPVRIEIRLSPTNWLTIYETTTSSNNMTEVRLEVVHSDGQPNKYNLIESAKTAGPRILSASEIMRPFAGSDFWIADLGLEFLHWPKQRLLMNDMRHHKSCSVLESINPQPSPGGYARVMSWVTVDSPHVVVHAEAFDAGNQLVKKFDPKNLEKVNGQYELESMEIRSPKAGSRTILEFDLK